METRMDRLGPHTAWTGIVFALILALACSDANPTEDGDRSPGNGADEDEASDEDDADQNDDGKTDGDDDDDGTAEDEEGDDDPGDNAGRRDAGARNDAGTPSPSERADAASPGPRSDGGNSSRSDAGRPPASGMDSGTTPRADGGQTLPPVTDYTRPGPFPTTTLTSQGPSRAYTIVRPRTLGEDGFKHPPLIFGCGIITDPGWYPELFAAIASHGFVIIASNSVAVTEQDLRTGLEWILEQNDGPGDYQGKLDVQRAVSMGYSIGGTAAVLVGDNPSVATTVSIHGHVAESALHGPLLQLTGTEDSVGVPLQQRTYELSQVQTFLATLEGATHFEILSGGGRELGPIVAWLRFWIFNDEGAKSFFYGDDCTLCTEPWVDPQRKNWQ